ncbi:uncharacterized protein ACIBXB_009573, partial [Morphnus guianensis]
MPAETGRGAAASRLCDHRARGGWGKLRHARDPPAVCIRLPATRTGCRLRSAQFVHGLRLKAREKAMRCRHLHPYNAADLSTEPSCNQASRGRPDTTGRPHMAHAGRNRTRRCGLSPVRSPGPRGLGEAAARTRPPSRLHRAAGHRDRLPLARSGLRPEKKGRGAAPSPTHPRALRSRRQPRWAGRSQAAALAYTSTHLCHHRALRGRGKADTGSTPPVFQRSSAGSRRRPPGFALRNPPLPLAPVGQQPPEPAGPSRAAGWLTWKTPGDNHAKQSNEPSHQGKPPPRPPSAPLRRLSRRHCTRSLALLHAPVTTTSY